MKGRGIHPGLLILVLLAICYAAATAAAEATAKRVSLHDYLPYEKGRTTIGWDINDSGSSRYVVTYKMIDNGTAKQSELEAGRTYGNSIETTGIIPGKCYEITVKDADGNILDQKAYRMDEAETFEDGKLKNTSVKIYVKPSMMESGKDPKQISGLKAADIEKSLSEVGKYYGVRYQMSMPQLKEERTFFVTMALESPDGYVYADKATDITFSKVSKGKESIYWKIAGVEFFLKLYMTNGSIPSGKYTAHLFWDGKWVNSSTFVVK